MDRPLKLVGKTVYLDEIQPKYFAYVIRWRNNQKLNRFLNQPYELTPELQERWFAQYQQDDTQGLLVMADKKTEKPFGTIGWTDLDTEVGVCIAGRLLVGNEAYQGSVECIEGIIRFMDYLYGERGMKKIYIHVAQENTKALRLNRKFGFVENRGIWRYPQERKVNHLDQIEFVRDQAEYKKARERIMLDLSLLL